MESKAKSKKRNFRPLIFAPSALGVFVLFVSLLTMSSTQSEAISEVKKGLNIADVKSVWDKYKADLSSDEDFLFEVRTKLSSFNLSEGQVNDCRSWLPKPATSLNLIVVPDLSSRIIDTLNNPDQIKNDTILLNHIWKTFTQSVRTKMNSKDRLIVDVTDPDQAQGKFRMVANNLIFDLSEHKDKSNKLFFDKVGDQFSRNIAELYSMAKAQPQGADYWSFFNQNLQRNIKQSTLFDEYRNILILITDGYLEAQNNSKTGVAFYTGGYIQRSEAFNKLKSGETIDQAISSSISPILDCSQHFSNLEVLVLEVNPRTQSSKQEPSDRGTPRDFDIMKKLWKDWFARLEIKNAGADNFVERLNATDLVKKRIESFINK